MKPLNITLEKVMAEVFCQPQIGMVSFLVYEPLESDEDYDDFDDDGEYLKSLDRKKSWRRVPAAELLNNGFNVSLLLKSLQVPEKMALGIASAVMVERTLKHAFLIDFEDPGWTSEGMAVEDMKTSLKALGQRCGYLIRSDDQFSNDEYAYHYYGVGELLEHDNWLRIMNEAKHFDCIGYRYPEFMLAQACCVLRVSGYKTSGNDTRTQPRVIGLIEL